MTRAFPEVVPVLPGDGLTLREMTEADVPAWFERASDPESSALSGDPIPESIEICYGWLETHRRNFTERTSIRWAIVPDGTDRSIGSIGISNISTDGRVAEIGAVIARSYWNRGIVTRATGCVVEYSMVRLGLEEIRAETLCTNLAAIRVLERLGFRLDRTIADYRNTDTMKQDGHLYVYRG